jgi:hypothetical protein
MEGTTGMVACRPIACFPHWLHTIRVDFFVDPFPGAAPLEKMISGLKYRAFSYSHRDTPWARWLHNALERYRIDGDLVGKATPTPA